MELVAQRYHHIVVSVGLIHVRPQRCAFADGKL
jgi:hypothetical protein